MSRHSIQGQPIEGNTRVICATPIYALLGPSRKLIMNIKIYIHILCIQNVYILFGKLACNGDSGGPLMKGETQVGVVSYGSIFCGLLGSLSVFSSITGLRSFIDAVL